jgi:hypothetical protein
MSSRQQTQQSREQVQREQVQCKQREEENNKEENINNDDDNDVELLQALALTDDERRRAFQALDSFAFAK